jgi:signal transduction histidine kinase
MHDQRLRSDDILVVDDEIHNLQLLTQFLSAEGYRVRPAERPQLAIEAARAQPPSLILLDVRMPEMDGFEVCEQLKQDERTRDIPIVFVSALQDVEDRVRGFEAGGVDFVCKPFQEPEVLARVRTHLSLHNMQLHLKELVAERTGELELEVAERKRTERTLLDHQQRLKALAAELTVAEERERRRIATDLHDNVGQNLALSLLQLAAAENAVDGAAVEEQLKEIAETLSTAVRDTQELIFDLSSPTLDTLGLGAAIVEWVDQKVKPQHGLDVVVVDKHDRRRLGHRQNTILFRNVRELLTNILKHAQANKATVLLEHEEEAIRVTVKDNGIGFNPEKMQRNLGSEGGLGLFSIEERMSDLGGSVVIDSKAYYGATIVMAVPCDGAINAENA